MAEVRRFKDYTEEDSIYNPKNVYKCVEDKVVNAAGEKELTLEAVVDGKRIPVTTKINGLEENHFDFDDVKATFKTTGA